ncbi:hypothetical protein FEI14_05590 [Lacticaseibacillus zeae]|uniref:Uncharacterized protein n=1 Tax=Lacticaseibacillus zeae TaxID=57037 RepID=A0A5R8LYE7_LACZE|nr:MULTISPECIES: hypothetical protein [Lacticaseibacillus]TLF42364.1 hypothetical protein FEI14_05590 [Lacticaseibacillus zeae]
MLEVILEIVMIVAIISLQTFFGYIGNKILGALLPVALMVVYIYFIAQGQIHFSIIDIVLPIVGLMALISIWAGGRKTKLRKTKVQEK